MPDTSAGPAGPRRHTRRASTSRLPNDAPVRVHFVAHHHLDRAAGVSGATMSLGSALTLLGCEVSYYSFDDAFGATAGADVQAMSVRRSSRASMDWNRWRRMICVVERARERWRSRGSTRCIMAAIG